MKSEQPSSAQAEPSELSTARVLPESKHPSREASQDDEYSKYDDPKYWDPKWGQDPPQVWEPYLQEFTVFPKLPIEIRQAIWKATLKPRIVEIKHSAERGYWSWAKVPVPLRVNKDSRNAVGLFYPLCFGNILHEPRIVFNFAMDTLYFEAWMWTEVPRFLVCLKSTELGQIRFIAVDHEIDTVREWDEEGDNPYNNMDCFRKAAISMPALMEFHIVYKLDEMWHDHGFPEGRGPIQLFEEFPYDVQQYLFHECIHLDDEDGQSECQELPNSDHMLEGFNVAKKGSIWGWRPTKLKLNPYPWD